MNSDKAGLASILVEREITYRKKRRLFNSENHLAFFDRCKPFTMSKQTNCLKYYQAKIIPICY
jgi:hypothetical protein